MRLGRAAFVLLAMSAAVACSQVPEAAPPSKGNGASAAALPSQKIRESVEVRLPDGFVVEAELADEPRERTIGMMGRQNVPEGTGMLFVFPDASHHSFWMKNCLTSLDIAWLAETPGGGRVVHLEQSLPPCREEPCPSWYPMRAARFVLELGAGEASRHGVRPGALVAFRLPE